MTDRLMLCFSHYQLRFLPVDSGVRPPFLHCKLTRLDVLQQHPNVVVPVRAGLLVVEAQGVQKLVLNSPVVQAAAASQRHSLGTTLAANIGVAPWRERGVRWRGEGERGGQNMVGGGEVANGRGALEDKEEEEELMK